MALAVAHVDGKVTGGAPTTSGSWTSTAGSCLVAIGHLFANAGAAASGDMTDSKSNTWTLRGSIYGGAGQPGTAIYEQNNGTRGAAHTVTFAPTAGAPTISNIAVVEITGQDLVSDFDATTFATAADTSAPFSPWNVTAAGAISGNQIGVYAVTVDATAGTGAWTNPTGYTNIINQNDAAVLVSYAGYKINETGTPTVGAVRSDTSVVGGRMLLATFKEATSVGVISPIPVHIPWMPSPPSLGSSR